jgi:GNAT superfamily N-acetyltransferase
LDDLAIKNLPDGFYHKTNIEMIKKSLDSGLSMGLFKDDEMIGYRLTLLPYLNSYNLGHFLEFEDHDLREVAQFYETLILSEYRGLGLGRYLINKNKDFIFRKGFKIILVTAHPKNKISLKLLEECNFKKEKDITFYNNLPRVLLSCRNI